MTMEHGDEWGEGRPGGWWWCCGQSGLSISYAFRFIPRLSFVYETVIGETEPIAAVDECEWSEYMPRCGAEAWREVN